MNQNMASVITPKSDQLNADDLIAGPMTITIEEVQITGGQEQPVSIFFQGSKKAYRPCKSMCRVLVAAWGPDAKKYTGKSLTLFRDATVKWAGMEVGGIRISHMSHMEAPLSMALTASKGKRAAYIVRPLVMTEPAKPATKPKPSVADLESALAELKSAAKQGTDALKSTWESLSVDEKKALQSSMPALKEEAANVGKTAAPPSDDTSPFAD